MHTCLEVLMAAWNGENFYVLHGSYPFPSTCTISRVSLHTSQTLLAIWLGSHICHCFLYNLLLKSALVSDILGKWLQDFLSFRNPWYPTTKLFTKALTHTQFECMHKSNTCTHLLFLSRQTSFSSWAERPPPSALWAASSLLHQRDKLNNELPN